MFIFFPLRRHRRPRHPTSCVPLVASTSMRVLRSSPATPARLERLGMASSSLHLFSPVAAQPGMPTGSPHSRCNHLSLSDRQHARPAAASRRPLSLALSGSPESTAQPAPQPASLAAPWLALRLHDCGLGYEHNNFSIAKPRPISRARRRPRSLRRCRRPRPSRRLSARPATRSTGTSSAATSP